MTVFIIKFLELHSVALEVIIDIVITIIKSLCLYLVVLEAYHDMAMPKKGIYLD